jgi:hypothetical protein
MDTELVHAIADAVAERIRADIEKVVRTAAVRGVAGGKAVLSRRESATFLDQSPRTLEKWASKGEGPRLTRFGRSIGHTVEALSEFVYEHQSPASSPAPEPKPRVAKRRVVKGK